jgi:hypothetical protein
MNGRHAIRDIWRGFWAGIRYLTSWKYVQNVAIVVSGLLIADVFLKDEYDRALVVMMGLLIGNVAILMIRYVSDS